MGWVVWTGSADEEVVCIYIRSSDPPSVCGYDWECAFCVNNDKDM